jgi:hypothetical protein
VEGAANTPVKVRVDSVRGDRLVGRLDQQEDGKYGKVREREDF